MEEYEFSDYLFFFFHVLLLMYHTSDTTSWPTELYLRTFIAITAAGGQ